jgi:hypothetical protein
VSFETEDFNDRQDDLSEKLKEFREALDDIANNALAIYVRSALILEGDYMKEVPTIQEIEEILKRSNSYTKFCNKPDWPERLATIQSILAKNQSP